MLEEIRNSYMNSSLKIRVELYILPLLLVVLFFSFYDFKGNSIQSLDYEKSFNKKFDGSLINLIEKIEKFSSINKIQITHITNAKRYIYIKANGSISSVKKLLKEIDFINSYSSIKSFSINKKGKTYFFDISIDFSKYYIKRAKKQKKSITKQKNYKLIAIVGKNILINEKWLSIGEKIDDLELIELGANHVVLKGKKKRVILEVYKNEKVK